MNTKTNYNFNAEVLFDGDDELFKSLAKNLTIYFEYGVGKSTKYIHNYTNSNIYAVDTNRQWVQNISKFCNKNSRLNLKWINVGEVEDWGYPKSFILRKNFVFYTNWFWKKNYSPDLVLIDGRFRISCFLTTVKNAPIGTKILFDDYATRPLYHVAEEFLPVIDTCGRQALFQVTQKSKKNINCEIISSFQNVLI